MPKKNKTERESIDDVVTRLRKKFPDLSKSDVADIVDAQYAKMQGAKLREYIPVLVEHEAKQILKSKKR